MQRAEISAPDWQPVNLAAGSLILYEAQVRTANACRPDVGTPEQRAACAAKKAPPPIYRAEGMSCPIQTELAKIKLGTLDDMVEDTSDFRRGITVRYVNEMVRANALWLMPLFPNNDRWHVPDGCDNLGSPYAVRDYLHASGTLSRACIDKGRDEYAANPCWANAELDRLIAAAKSRGMRVMLDIAINHFGHNYLSYDYGDVTIDGGYIASSGNLDSLWDFDRTFDASLLQPVLLDSIDALEALRSRSGKDRQLYAELKSRCPSLDGDTLVRSFAAYRLALPHERAAFVCSGYLEHQVPGFYLGANRFDPSTNLVDNFTNNWPDVKFLFHHEENLGHLWEFSRDREYLFRILNYWVSRGIEGFRFDHTTDFSGGMGSNEWKYLLTKVSYYAQKRGQPKPVFLAEEFHSQQDMNRVMDILSEGYLNDMAARGGVHKSVQHIEGVLDNMGRFGDRGFVMTALETHDEQRLTEDTGFNAWTGVGFWGIGAATRSTPMLLMGQELGARWRLGFKRSDFLRARFPFSEDAMAGADALVAYYGRMNAARLDPANRALLAPSHAYLRTRDGNAADPRIFAMAKWSSDGNVMLIFHNLWEQDVAQAYMLPAHLLDANLRYRFFDVLSQRQMGECRFGYEIRGGLFVGMDWATRAQWLRLERCS